MAKKTPRNNKQADTSKGQAGGQRQAHSAPNGMVSVTIGGAGGHKPIILTTGVKGGAAKGAKGGSKGSGKGGKGNGKGGKGGGKQNNSAASAPKPKPKAAAHRCQVVGLPPGMPDLEFLEVFRGFRATHADTGAGNGGAFVDFPSASEMQRALKEDIEVEWPDGGWKSLQLSPVPQARGPAPGGQVHGSGDWMARRRLEPAPAPAAVTRVGAVTLAASSPVSTQAISAPPAAPPPGSRLAITVNTAAPESHGVRGPSPTSRPGPETRAEVSGLPPSMSQIELVSLFRGFQATEAHLDTVRASFGYVDFPTVEQMERALAEDIEVEWPGGDWRTVKMAPCSRGGVAAADFVASLPAPPSAAAACPASTKASNQPTSAATAAVAGRGRGRGGRGGRGRRGARPQGVYTPPQRAAASGGDGAPAPREVMVNLSSASFASAERLMEPEPQPPPSRATTHELVLRPELAAAAESARQERAVALAGAAASLCEGNRAEAAALATAVTTPGGRPSQLQPTVAEFVPTFGAPPTATSKPLQVPSSEFVPGQPFELEKAAEEIGMKLKPIKKKKTPKLTPAATATGPTPAPLAPPAAAAPAMAATSGGSDSAVTVARAEVGGLPATMPASELESLFRGFGAVATELKPGLFRGLRSGIVDFRSEADRARAIQDPPEVQLMEAGEEWSLVRVVAVPGTFKLAPPAITGAFPYNP